LFFEDLKFEMLVAHNLLELPTDTHSL
jgi:hypothetical protein